jgi:hypothetical protein
MNSIVKIPLQLSRKTLLLLTRVIEKGITFHEETPDTGILAVLDAEALAEIKGVSSTLLDKSGLSEMNTRLDALEGGK